MKRKCVLIILVFAFVSINSYAQTNEQRLVGTWTNLHNNSTITFNSNGTFSGSEMLSNARYWYTPTNWAAAGDILIVYSGSDRNDYRIQISNDGKTLIIGTTAYRRSS